MQRCGALLVVLVAFVAWPPYARAEMPSFEAFYRGVTECSLDLARFGEALASSHDAMVIALPSAKSVNGLLVDSFFFSPGRESEPERYGLLINAPLDVVGKSLPELVGRRTVNGHVRDLVRMSERSREQSASRKTLLLCTGGMSI